jgi:hypothetical protein
MKNLMINDLEIIQGGDLCNFTDGFFAGLAVGSMIFGNAPAAGVFLIADVAVSMYCNHR